MTIHYFIQMCQKSPIHVNEALLWMGIGDIIKFNGATKLSEKIVIWESPPLNKIGVEL